VPRRDKVMLPDASRRAASKAGALAKLREYTVDLVDVYRGDWRWRVVADQADFLSRRLAPANATTWTVAA
jgi:hypothetical protein